MKIFSFFKNNDDGASAVEFAIVLPLFLLFIFGIIEFGIIMYDKAMITNASREGARIGILYVDPPLPLNELKAKVEDRVKDKLGTNGESILISLGGEAAFSTKATIDPDDKYLKVIVEYPYVFLLPKLLGFTDLKITAATTMRMENQES